MCKLQQSSVYSPVKLDESGENYPEELKIGMIVRYDS